MKEVMKVVMFLPKQIQILLMVILPTAQKFLRTVDPRHTPTEPECLTNSFPSQGFTNFSLLSNKCCEETVDLNLFCNTPNILKKVQVSLQAAE